MQQQMVPVDSIEVAPYKVGYSFRNPPVVKPLTEYRRQFFRMKWAAEGPGDKKEAMWNGGQLRRYPTVWRRAAKTSSVAGLSGVEMPNFDELGSALPPTSTKDNVERSVWGTLTNNITNAVSTVFNEQQKLAMAKMQPQYPQSGYMPMFYSQDSGIGVAGWSMIILGGGVVAYMIMKR
jgi:hypothetical protein